MVKLIVLRGNSGSGKTTIAKRLQQEMGYGTMLVSQDVVRREMLRVRDTDNNPAIELIYQLCMYGNKIGYNVILEGILNKKIYGKMLCKLLHDFVGQKTVYYFDLSFEETLKRHITKPNAHEFGEKEMRRWWSRKDYLGVENELRISEDQSEQQIVDRIKTAIFIDNNDAPRR